MTNSLNSQLWPNRTRIGLTRFDTSNKRKWEWRDRRVTREWRVRKIDLELGYYTVIARKVKSNLKYGQFISY